MNFSRPLEVMTPTLDADVLAVLARAESELSGREIQRMARRGSHQGIRNAADRLAREGVLLSRSVGAARVYRLNRDHVAASWIEGLAHLPGQVVDRLREAIAGWSEPPVVAFLFGSMATGGSTAASDLDLLIVRPATCDPEGPIWQAQTANLQERATAWTGNDARIVEYGEEELAHAEDDGPLRDALRDGIELYGSRRALRRAKRTGSKG